MLMGTILDSILAIYELAIAGLRWFGGHEKAGFYSKMPIRKPVREGTENDGYLPQLL